MIEYTVDWLKKNHTMVHAFGLGFIQVKLNLDERLHFWHTGFKREREEVHNHRYDFESTIIHGQMKQELFNFEVKADGGYEMFLANCVPGDKGQFNPVASGDLRLTFSGVLATGSVYHLRQDTLHRIEATRCVTHLRRLYGVDPDLACPKLPRTKTHASVVRVKGAQSTCPFTEKLSESNIWGMIEDLLKTGICVKPERI